MSARRALARRLASLSGSEQQRFAVAFRLLVDKRRAELGLGANLRTDPGRDPKIRLPYAHDPHAYARDILGVTLTPQQEQLLQAFKDHRRVIAPSATNVGKSFVAACGILWLFDAVAALPTTNGSEQGCIVLLLGPDHATIRATSYARLIEIYKHCASRGVRLPGVPREASVTWRVSERWFVAPVSPPKHVGETVAHAASGRHSPNMIALGEEAIGIQPAVLAAVEGGFNAPGNRIWLPLNPTEMRPHIRERAENGAYNVLSLSALDHPNVRERRTVVPGAVSLEHVEHEIQAACRDIGPYPEHRPDPDKRDFIYALPPEAADPSLARGDDIPGHLEGTPRVYRPQGLFAAQILGQTPAEGTSGLFDPAAVEPSSSSRVASDCAAGVITTLWSVFDGELRRMGIQTSRGKIVDAAASRPGESHHADDHPHRRPTPRS
ncbi:MAG: hypothetical protein HC897_13030, partial [Thermoanaerobaculia bacterium]|nr:hypothetical protein [Thermoanaerobaculia bacterium]